MRGAKRNHGKKSHAKLGVAAPQEVETAVAVPVPIAALTNFYSVAFAQDQLTRKTESCDSLRLCAFA